MGSSSPFLSLLLIAPLILISIFHLSLSSHLHSSHDGFISVSISENGLNFLKELLVQRAISSLTPLEIAPIEKHVRIPLVGRVYMALSNITIYHVDVPSSYVKSNESGITISAAGATAYLRMNWEYSYKTWLVEVSDRGNASVQVKGMEVGLTISVKSKKGALKLSLMEYGCSVADIDIDMDGGAASWLYQGLVDAFSEKIESAVEDAISKKIRVGISTVDSLLQSLPREVSVDETSALNVTLVDDPSLSESSVNILIDGLFMSPVNLVMQPIYKNQRRQGFISSKESNKMLAISLHEEVVNSASLIYFNADLMWWNVDRLPDQSLLNTSKWKNILPELYEQFPDDQINLNISVTSPPSVEISEKGISTSIDSDVTLMVLDREENIQVVCVSVVIEASGSAHISGNNLTGSIDLENIGLSMKWSKIGDIDLDNVQPMISKVIEDVLLPRLNMHLMRGFPLPLIHGFTLCNAELLYANSRIMACGDVEYVEGRGRTQLDLFLWSLARVDGLSQNG